MIRAGGDRPEEGGCGAGSLHHEDKLHAVVSFGRPASHSLPRAEPVSNGPLILELICLTEEFFKCGYVDCLSIHQPTYLPTLQRSRLKSSRLDKTDSVKSAMPGRIETLFLAALFALKT